MKEPPIQIGKVIREHGIKGELRVHFFNAQSPLLKKGLSLSLKVGEKLKKTQISFIKPHQKAFLCAFEGVFDRETAFLWRQAEVWIDRKEIMVKQEQEFLWQDIIGFRVFYQNKDFGTITRFVDRKFQPLIEIKKGSQKYLLPFVKNWITKLDSTEKTIEFEAPEGIFD